VFVAALLAARGLPAILYRGRIGGRGVRIAALLQATSLPFLVTAVEIGVAIDALAPATGAALVAAGLVSVVLFPPRALAELARLDDGSAAAPATSVAAGTDAGS